MSEEQDIDELFGDDEVQDDAQQQQADDEEDLFGDNDAEAEEQQEDERQGQRDDGATGQPIHIEAPLTNLPAADKLHLLNLKNNLIGLQPKPFDPDTYERETGYVTDAQTGEKKPLLVHDNTIRWRWQQNAHGQLEMVSNARMVQWDDGSQQLMIGDEAFDVVNQDISQNGMYLYTVGGIIQGQAQLTSRLAFRPASFQSKTHQRVREKAVRGNAVKATKVGTHASIVDPEKEKAAREKEEEQRVRAKVNLDKQQDRVQRRYNIAAGQRKLNASYLEGLDDEYEDFAQQQQRRRDDGDDEDMTPAQRARAALQRPRGLSPAEEAAAAARLESAKRPMAPASGAKPYKRQRLQDDDDEGSDEEGGAGGREDVQEKARAKARRGVVLSDDEDE